MLGVRWWVLPVVAHGQRAMTSSSVRRVRCSGNTTFSIICLNGGNLGAMGCVGFLFSQKGVIDISLEDKDADEAMMDALDAGAEDFDASEDAAEITTDPENYSAVVKAMEEKGYEILSDDLAMVPMTTTRLTDPDQLKLMGKLLDALEDNDDVQNVWHSLENEEDLPE